MKECVLYDRDCIYCDECFICDLDREKMCDNCEECIKPENDYAKIIIDEIISPNSQAKH